MRCAQERPGLAGLNATEARRMERAWLAPCFPRTLSRGAGTRRSGVWRRRGPEPRPVLLPPSGSAPAGQGEAPGAGAWGGGGAFSPAPTFAGFWKLPRAGLCPEAVAAAPGARGHLRGAFAPPSGRRAAPGSAVRPRSRKSAPPAASVPPRSLELVFHSPLNFGRCSRSMGSQLGFGASAWLSPGSPLLLPVALCPVT